MQNYQNTIDAAKKCGIEESVEQISDTDEILQLGVMATPGLVIDGKVVSSGKLLSVDQIAEFINKHKT